MSRSRTVLWTVGVAVSAALGVAGMAASQGASPVEQRQAAMKQVGQQMKAGGAYTSAATPFDAAKVKALMDGVAADATKLRGLYPAGSDADPKSAADPKIWQNKADFDKRLAELARLASVAGAATSTDAYKPAFSAVGGTCKSCHDIYRKKKLL
jgi:cytochrome c556